MPADAGQPPPTSPTPPEDGPRTVERLSSPELVSELRGDLPCARCRYNLKGISVRDNCPECGTPVRVTILAKVDPYAPVLRPIGAPRVIATGLVLWVLGPLIAAAATWAQRVIDLSPQTLATLLPARELALVGVAGIVLSAAGALALVRPHTGIKPRYQLGAVLGIVATIAASLLYWQIHGEVDLVSRRPYTGLDPSLLHRSLLRLALAGACAVAIVVLRPNARLLASRSHIMRMGHVDRQTMLALVAALGVAAVGDALQIAAHFFSDQSATTVLVVVGTLLIAIGSMFFTLGLVGMLIDAVRIVPVVLRPPLSMGQLLAGTRGVRRGGGGPEDEP